MRDVRGATTGGWIKGPCDRIREHFFYEPSIDPVRRCRQRYVLPPFNSNGGLDRTADHRWWLGIAAMEASRCSRQRRYSGRHDVLSDGGRSLVVLATDADCLSIRRAGSWPVLSRCSAYIS